MKKGYLIVTVAWAISSLAISCSPKEGVPAINHAEETNAVILLELTGAEAYSVKLIRKQHATVYGKPYTMEIKEYFLKNPGIKDSFQFRYAPEKFMRIIISNGNRNVSTQPITKWTFRGKIADRKLAKLEVLDVNFTEVRNNKLCFAIALGDDKGKWKKNMDFVFSYTDSDGFLTP